MPALQIVSTRPLAGKTTLAVSIAQGIAREARVRLERLGSGVAATADAETFGDFLFAGSTGAPLAQAPPLSSDETLILELDAGAEPLRDLPAIIAVRRNVDEADAALAKSLGERLLGTIAVAADPAGIESLARDITNSGMRPLAVEPEERILTSPSVGEIGEALRAEMLFSADNDSDVVEDIVIAPVYADPARPHFRRFASKAILSPFNKTDLHLVAIETQAACLVITGGKSPSPYVIDRAQHGSTTVFLAREDTPGTVAGLSDIWSKSRFRGQAKAAAAFASLEGRLDFAGLLKKIEG